MPVTEARCLGLIGGLGPPATVYYYRGILAGLDARGIAARMLIAHADLNHVRSAVEAKDYDGLARYLANLIDATKAGGAELAAIVAITPHICAPQLMPISPLPLIDIVTTVSDEVRAQGRKRVALLGTRFTIETRMFGRLEGIDVVMPQPAEVEQIHNAYMNIVNGRNPAGQIAVLRELAHTFIRRDGAEIVLLAGTDLSTEFNASNTDFPAIDCARLHVDAIVQQMLA
jgi:aspartate racemase